MINPKQFYETIKENGIDFFTGVPDSLLKDICAYISDNTPKEKNIISANEGGAIALATGYHLATNKIPLVYMQNSGLGNTVIPLLSLTDPYVYSIPLLLMVGWRG
jgi:phosphonopyruvate decarboxylase